VLTENIIVYWFILRVNWSAYFPNIEPRTGQFCKYQDRRFILDDDYLYFYSKDEKNEFSQILEYENVGELREKMKMFKLPIDKRIVDVLKGARKIEDLRLLYDPSVVKRFMKKNSSEILDKYFDILNGKIDLDQELQNSIILENYEECAVIRDTLNLTFLKNLWK